MTCDGEDGRAYQMHLRKGDPSYRITQRPTLLPEPGTRGADPRHPAGHQEFQRREDPVVPRLGAARPHSSFRRVDSGRSIEPRGPSSRSSRASSKADLLHELDGLLPAQSEIYAELYLHAHSPANAVSLYRSGTRVLGDLAELEVFARMPWTSGYVQGIIDAPYLNLTPGNATWRHPRCGAGAPGRRARAARGAARQDHRGPAAGRGGAGEPRCAALGAGRAQGGAAGAAGGGVRLVRPASRRGQASPDGRRTRSARWSTGRARRARRGDRDRAAIVRDAVEAAAAILRISPARSFRC